MMFDELVRERSAREYASFFLDVLDPSHTVLDCGCGEGSITVGLAEHTPFGRVVGIDLAPDEFDGARAYARRMDLLNLQFCAGDMLCLPFPNGSFAAAFCHSALETLQEPEGGLAEIYRVLKTGGVIGAACVEYEGVVIAGPNEKLLYAFYAAREKLWRAEGWAEPRLGKHLRGLLHKTGFVRVSQQLAYISYGTRERVARFGSDRAQECRDPALVEAVTKHNRLPHGELDAMASAWEEWSVSPEAFFGFTWARAVGYKPEAAS